MKSSEAVAVLGGSLVKKDGKWRTTNFDEGDNFGVQGDRIRVIAASLLYKKKKTKIIALGGRGQLENIPDSPPVSEIIKDELVELGVKPEDVVCERNSGNTFRQLVELGKIVNKEKLKKIALITNEWHFPRIRAMLEYNPVLTKQFFGCKILFTNAESILLKYDSEKWRKVIEVAHESDAMKKRIARESAGVKQIKEGTYNYGN